MNDENYLKELRRKNLQAIIDNDFGGVKRQLELALSDNDKSFNVGRLLTETATNDESRRNIGEKLARKIEKKLNYPPFWLDTDHTSEASNVSPPMAKLSRVPVINYVQAGHWTEVIEPGIPQDDAEWVYTDIQSRKQLFALRVQGDSMEPEFPEGSMLIVEPSAEWRAGHYVIAANGSHEATFKQLARDGDAWFLKPCNPRYPIQRLTAAHRIIGVVVQTVRNLSDRRSDK